MTANTQSSFFDRLPARSRSQARYFKVCFRPSSPTCECDRFPVFSSKVKLGEYEGDAGKCKLAAVSHLCLDCIHHVLDWKYGTEPEIGDVFLTAQLRSEYIAFYNTFYTTEEAFAMERAEEYDFYDRNMEVIMPWLSKRGVRRTCPHAGVPFTCPQDTCSRGTEHVVVA
jgi:hypothetical protein